MASIYLDTSFISACVTDRKDAGSVIRRAISREWWASQRASHTLFISQEVFKELSSAGFTRQRQAMALIADLPLLEIDQEVTGIAQVFVKEYLMPGPVIGDAIHVAACAAYGMEYLLSWNVRHLANPNKIEHLQIICRRLGLVPPKIVTPELLWE